MRLTAAQNCREAWAINGDQTESLPRILQAFGSLGSISPKQATLHAKRSSLRAKINRTTRRWPISFLALLTTFVVSAKAEQAFANCSREGRRWASHWIQFAEMGGSAGVLINREAHRRDCSVRRIIKLADEKYAIPVNKRIGGSARNLSRVEHARGGGTETAARG